jgi:DnaK suppressor protein
MLGKVLRKSRVATRPVRTGGKREKGHPVFFKIFVDYLCSFATVAPLVERNSFRFGGKPGSRPTKFLRVTTKKKEIKKAAPRIKAHTSASAAAILGRPVVSNPKVRLDQRGPRKVKPEWQKYYDRLLELREQLMQQMNGLAKESAQEIAGYSLHMADSGTDNFDRDFALSLLSSDQDAVYEIEEALKRIERGTYGVCELTGKAIPKARLEAIPWARFTVTAQAQLEREGALRQRRLGQLGTVDAAATADVEEDADDGPEEKPTKEKE